MALDSKAQAALALHRFGLGPKAGSIAAIASDPRGALLAEIDPPNAGRINDPELMTVGEAARATYDYRKERKAARLVDRAAKEAEAKADTPAPSDSNDNMSPAKKPEAAKPGPSIRAEIFRDEAQARVNAALSCDFGFAERLVWFWSNHFCVSTAKGVVRSLAGAFERETIRPHALGSFSDMLLAVETHPAMLIYLDNARSIGPNSKAGIRRSKGLNENLAREILELHTLGVRTVYNQNDVTNFAKVITGWTIIPPKEEDGGGEFVFNERLHEPGSQMIIGKTYPAGGFEQGRAVLSDLAKHKATAQHVATKLARYFVDDEPPPALVSRLTKVFLDTGGDLKQMARALITAPEAWTEARNKLKRPSEWLIGALRATGVTQPDVRPFIQAQITLGEPLWQPPAPKGFDDFSGPWMDGLPQRLEVANQFVRRGAAAADPKATLEVALGSLASEQTRQAISRAESRPQALALLLMAPEFQRR